MCQICAISLVAKKDRWPKPVEASKPDLDFLVTTTHDTYTHYQHLRQNSPNTPIPESLLDQLRLLSKLLNSLEDDRETWWTSPEKRDMRKKFELEGNQKDLSQLHKINNATMVRFEEMQAKLGVFVKWSLGMNGGVFELENAWRVAGLVEK
jgi:hypothetical protein